MRFTGTTFVCVFFTIKFCLCWGAYFWHVRDRCKNKLPPTTKKSVQRDLEPFSKSMRPGQMAKFFWLNRPRGEVQTFEVGNPSKACLFHCFPEEGLTGLKQEPSSPALSETHLYLASLFPNGTPQSHWLVAPGQGPCEVGNGFLGWAIALPPARDSTSFLAKCGWD